MARDPPPGALRKEPPLGDSEAKRAKVHLVLTPISPAQDEEHVGLRAEGGKVPKNSDPTKALLQMVLEFFPGNIREDRSAHPHCP